MEFSEKSNYINRELSWLDFNFRVLSEARDKGNPILERIKFLAITCSNLDEFFMVRVASLKDMVREGFQKQDAAGMTPEQQLEAISKKTHDFADKQYSTYNRSLLPLLAGVGIHIVKREKLTDKQRSYLKKYFHDELYPVLTPMAVDSSRPFPLIQNKTLNICALIRRGESEPSFATLPVPSVFPRLVPLPSDKKGERCYILLEQILQEFLGDLFLGHEILCSHAYRIMRDADIPIDDREAEDLLEEIEKNLKKRERSSVIRLEVDDDIGKSLLKLLTKELEISKEDVYKINGPIDLTFLNQLYSEPGQEQYKYPGYTPQKLPCLQNVPIFDAIRRGDILMHHPFDSFDPVIELIRSAAADPAVLAIKQTLYRVSGNSPIIKYLSQAAENGKQVTVLVELKARFDEENNILWAKKLEQSGCHVIYGLVGLKTHSKIAVIVRREEDGIRRYVHLGTGNYNDITARFYTDMGMLTCSAPIGEDATAFFNMISGFSEPTRWNKLIVAPLWLREKTEELIRREIRLAKEGREARIIAKMNSLVDPGIIALLYEAGQQGVKIDLIVRGICCLKAGVKGLSENITVRSIVGRYLEHTRIYYFRNDGREAVYLSSADWMQRNLNKRVEIMFPVEDEALKQTIFHVLNVQLTDTMRSHIQKNGVYEKVDRRGKEKSDCQERLMEEALARTQQLKKDADRLEATQGTVFIPADGLA